MGCSSAAYARNLYQLTAGYHNPAFPGRPLSPWPFRNRVLFYNCIFIRKHRNNLNTILNLTRRHHQN
jgi:hypothetical protein